MSHLIYIKSRTAVAARVDSCSADLQSITFELGIGKAPLYLLRSYLWQT